MKKLIILISILSFIACHRDSIKPDESQTIADTYEEYDDSENDEGEDISLEERGANFRIDAFTPVSSSDLVPSNASRFAGYGLLDNLGGTNYKIVGYGFGATKGNSTIQLKYKTEINSQVPVISWSNTEIVFGVSKFSSIVAPILKNLSLRVIIERDSTRNGITTRKTVSRSTKVTGYYKDYYDYNNCFQSSEMAYYPTSLWEVAWEQYTRPSGSGSYRIRQAIDTNYLPKATDLLMRGSNATQYAIVQSVTGPVTSGTYVGRYTIKVNERNYKGNGSIQRKSYYYKKKDGFTPKYGEPKLTYYSLESGG